MFLRPEPDLLPPRAPKQRTPPPTPGRAALYAPPAAPDLRVPGRMVRCVSDTQRLLCRSVLCVCLSGPPVPFLFLEHVIPIVVTILGLADVAMTTASASTAGVQRLTRKTGPPRISVRP